MQPVRSKFGLLLILRAHAWFGGDLGIGNGVGADIAIAAPVGALLFVLTRKPYRRAMAA